MNYRENVRNGDKLSVLGFGCMRFTKKGLSVNQEKAEAEMKYAIEHGVNYFDTAYIYPGIEVAVGTFLAKGYRDKVYLATKLPHYMYKTIDEVEKCFSEQLRRLKTDYIDYYLIHMLNDRGSWDRLCEMGIKEWISDKKAKGQIKNIGFSFHGGTTSFIELIDAYEWEFCQIQYNYLDEYSQAGVKGLKYAAEKKLPVIIMEPLRGGRLVKNLPKGVKNVFDSSKKKRTPAEWGLRWLWNQPEVTVVLSGMNSIEQVEENIRIASDVQAGELTEADFKMFDDVKKEFNKAIKVGCTGCGYCMPCPFGVDIPVCFRSYNNCFSDNIFVGMREYVMCTSLKAKPSNASLCRKCGKCEQHCPQGIKIRDNLEQVKKKMENLIYKIFVFFARKFAKYE